MPALACWLATAGVALLGMYAGQLLAGGAAGESHLAPFARFDGQHYRRIETIGYTYKPGERSDLAFFPAYPLAARCVSWIADTDPILALLITSNALLALAMVLFGRYLGTRARAPRQVWKRPAAPRVARWRWLRSR